MTTNQSLKEIGNGFINDAFKLYPEWSEASYKPPEPTYSIALANVDLSKKQMAQVPIPPIPKSVLCGTIFGDSSFTIDKGYSNARFQLKQSTRQFTWFTWKVFVILKQYTTRTGLVFTRPDGYQATSPLRSGETILGKLKIASRASADLTALLNVIGVNKRKTIQRSWLNHMNNYFLMTLWLDDGSVYSLTGGRQGLLCLNSTPVDQQNVLRQYLLQVWGIKTRLISNKIKMTNGQTSYRISIMDKDNLLKLFRIIAPIIPVREMLYKVCFVVSYDLSESQRWKTELKGLVSPKFHPEIDTIYDRLAVDPSYYDDLT